MNPWLNSTDFREVRYMYGMNMVVYGMSKGCDTVCLRRTVLIIVRYKPVGSSLEYLPTIGNQRGVTRACTR